MKRCGRPRKNFKAVTATQVIQYPESGLPQSAPIIGSLVESGEFNLLDLSRLQAELEHLLASATERMVCLSSELTGTPLPPSILRHLGLLKAEELTHPCPVQAPSSLVVTANPNKPLSLIISSQRRQSADVQLPEARLATNENPGSLPVPVPAAPPSSSPSATEKGSNPAHDVPNRFWALMEPYCADITETNISYLESILKSYVEEATTAKYFQLPPEPNNAVSATDHNLRSAHHTPDHHLAHGEGPSSGVYSRQDTRKKTV
ncbi:transcriptional adaptor 3 [Sparganum proliferum]